MRQRTHVPSTAAEGSGGNVTGALIPIAVCFGLITGVGEVILRFARRLLLGQFNYLGQQVVWMAPLVDVIVFAALGLVFAALARWRDGNRMLQPALTVYAFLSAFTILMMFQPLHPVARVALAAGIAVQAGRLGVRWQRGLVRSVGTILGWPAVLWRRLRGRAHASSSSDPVSAQRREFLVGTGATLGTLALGVHGPPAALEWYGTRALPSPRPGAPNILLLVLDTVRAESLQLHGYHRDTSPNLTRLSERGAWFLRAYSHSPWTLPSHGSMFTGRYPHELSGTWHTALDARHRNLPEVLKEAGYLTAGFVANINYCSYESGLHRGFMHFEDYTVSFGEMLNSSVLGRLAAESDTVAIRRKYELLGRKPASTINRDFLSWLSKQDGRPFFAFLNYFDSHAPYLAPPPFDTRFGQPVARPNPRHLFSWKWTPDQSGAELDAYDNTIAYLDTEIDRLLTELSARKLLDNTVVIVTSDHGELFGEHGLMDHANSLYIPLLHVPLLMIWPGTIPAATKVGEPIGLRHLAATVLDLAGIGSGALPGQSWAPLWRQASATSVEPILSSLEQGIRVEPHWHNAKGSLYSLIVDTRHYIRHSDGREELYDLVADPGEQRNLAGSTETAMLSETLDRLRREGSG